MIIVDPLAPSWLRGLLLIDFFIFVFVTYAITLGSGIVLWYFGGVATLFTSRTISQFLSPLVLCCVWYELRDSYGLSLPWRASRLLVFDSPTDCLTLAPVLSCCLPLTCLTMTKDVRLFHVCQLSAAYLELSSPDMGQWLLCTHCCKFALSSLLLSDEVVDLWDVASLLSWLLT